MYSSTNILGRKILVLTAHPDDESFLAAGTIFANHQSGGQTILVCATLGEKGSSHLRRLVPERQLRQVRASELQKAANILKIKKTICLVYPDGQLENHQSQALAEISRLMPEIKPDLIMSFGPDGLTGHKDHIAISSVAKQIAEQHQLPWAAFCLPASLHQNAETWVKERRRTIHHYAKRFTLGQANISIPINPEIKLQALKCYQSQYGTNDPFKGFPPQVGKALLEQECFCLYS